MGTIGLILGLKVFRSAIMYDKNPITISMVLCMSLYSVMILAEGITILNVANIEKDSFIILIKLTWFGECIVMSCDFLVATLYLRNAVLLYTDKYSNILTKMLFFTWIAFSVVLVIYEIIDIA